MGIIISDRARGCAPIRFFNENSSWSYYTLQMSLSLPTVTVSIISTVLGFKFVTFFLFQKEGYLYKYRNIFKGWQYRYFKVSKDYFHYFEAQHVSILEVCMLNSYLRYWC